MPKRRRIPVDATERMLFGIARGRFLDRLARSGVSSTTFHIGYLIVSRMSPDSREAFPAYPLLRTEAHCSLATIKRAVAELVAQGWLVQVRIGSGRNSSIYTLDWSQWLPPKEEQSHQIDPAEIPF